MVTKLTLTVEEMVIQKAKNYAMQKGASLSSLVENYLLMITSDPLLGKDDIEITPRVRSLMGAFRAPAGFDYKAELSKALNDKYL